MNARLPALLLWIAITLAAMAACRSESAPPRFPHQTHLAGLACGVPGKARASSFFVTRGAVIPPRTLLPAAHGALR